MWVEEARGTEDPEEVVTAASSAGGEVFGADRNTACVRMTRPRLPSRVSIS